MPDPTGPVEAERAARDEMLDGFPIALAAMIGGATVEAAAAPIKASMARYRSAVRRAFAAEVRALIADAALVEAVEEDVGMGSGAWDCIRAERIIESSLRAALARLGEGA